MSQPEGPVRNAALEAAIRSNRDDPAPYLVYADFLQSRGEPFGEWIVLQHQLAAAKDAAKRQRADDLLRRFAFPGDKLATYEWRHGFWKWLRLENQKDWMDDEFDALALARKMFAHPACMVLDELRLGVLRWEYNAKDVPAVIDEAGKHEWARELSRLHLGDVDDDIDMDHHVIGKVGKRITKTFPRLTSLRLHSGAQDEDDNFDVAGLALPELTELVVETCSMSTDRLAAILAARLPKLEHLELWFGSDDYGADAGLDDLKPLLGGKVLTTVVHLGLRNAELADDIATAIASTAIASRLESLDLSMGTLGDDAAIELAAGAASFPKLRRLVVDDNFLTARSLDALRKAFAHAEVVSEDQKELEDDWRYVTVSE
jgi:uncharacterized protein (TIGR02996 family)